MAQPTAATHPDIFADLRSRVRGEVLLDALARAVYSTAADIFRIPPAGVIWPLDERDAAAVLAWAHRRAESGLQRIPIIPRGAGTGVAGQAIGTGLILDLSRHFRGILELTPQAGSIKVQPGVICDDLNRALARFGYAFPPDPSSSAYCTIGGMVSTNAAGAHTIRYGATIDYVQSLEAVLADGERVSFEEIPLSSLDGPAPQRESRAHQLARQVARIIVAAQSEIEAFTPKTLKNSSGYRLDRVIQDGKVNLSRLITGSEGTLAVVTSARLRVLPRPLATGTAVAFFHTLEEAGRCVHAIRALGPSALDMMDGRALEVVRQGRPDLAALIRQPAEALLFVEFQEQSDPAVAERLNQLREACSGAQMVLSPLDDEQRQAFWTVRKAFLPLLYRSKDRRQAVAFVEDVTVPPEHVVEYIRAFYAILDRHGVQAALSGHAGDGNFHARPFLDLGEPADRDKMKAIAEEVFELVMRLGGTLSGEHGDGLVRTPFLPRQFGPLYERFVQIKRLFDPHGILNPGKIIDDGTDELAQHLRATLSLPATYHERALAVPDQELSSHLHRCQACGNCRCGNDETNRMCPVFRALRSELVSPRARATLMRELLAGNLDTDEHARRELKELFDLCLLCRSCSLECPAEVDVPLLVQEVRARLALSLGLSPEERVMSSASVVSRFAAVAAPITNAAMKLRPTRWLMEKATGLDRRRPAIPFAFHTAQRLLEPFADRHEHKVVLFTDQYAGCNEPFLALKLAEVLDKNRRSVIFPSQTESGMPAIAYGDAARVRKIIRRNVGLLLPLVRQGYAVVTAEPTAALCLKNEYRLFDPSPEVSELGAHVFDLFQYLCLLETNGALERQFRSVHLRLGYHAPCHLRALQIGQPALRILRMIPDLHVEPLERGCCGMAGTFGMRTKNYELSMRIGRELFAALRNPMLDGALSDCSACRMQIAHGTGRPVFHPVEILHVAYGLSQGDALWDNWTARKS